MYWEGVEWPDGWTCVPINNPHSLYDGYVVHGEGDKEMRVYKDRHSRRLYFALLGNETHAVFGAEEALAKCVEHILRRG